jgi:hypothetical protein
MKNQSNKDYQAPKPNKTAHTNGPRTPSGDWHANNESLGMGDYYGTGIKAKLGKLRDTSFGFVDPKKVKTPPKNLA